MNETEQLKLTIPNALRAYARAHAYRRDVTVNRLASDILIAWCRRATPTDDPLFSLAELGFSLPEHPEEPYPGYLDTLRFLPESECAPVDSNAPPPLTKHEQWPDVDR